MALHKHSRVLHLCCSPPLSIPFVHPCYCSSSWMLLETGYSSSLRLPFVSVFVPLVVSNLFPYFSIYCYSFLWVRLGRKVLLVFHLFLCLSPLLIHCSVFFVLVALGKGLSLCPICFCARLSACSQLVLTLLSSLLLLPAHRMLIGCSLSIVCFRTCRPCCLHFVPFFLSFFLFFLSFLSFFLSFFLSLSLSLLLFFFLGACWDP